MKKATFEEQKSSGNTCVSITTMLLWKNRYNNEREDEEMKKFLLKAGITVASCLFFTVLVPILFTSAQNSLFSAGFGIMFVFFAICLYLLMTSTFFNSGKEAETKDEAAKDEKTLEPAA